MGLGALVLVVGLTVVQVDTAEELLMAIGPQRTVRLSGGSYDLSAVKPRELAFVKWAPSGEPPGITVHDVDALTIEGPAEGEARLTTGSALRLGFEAMRGFTFAVFGAILCGMAALAASAGDTEAPLSQRLVEHQETVRPPREAREAPQGQPCPRASVGGGGTC